MPVIEHQLCVPLEKYQKLPESCLLLCHGQFLCSLSHLSCPAIHPPVSLIILFPFHGIRRDHIINIDQIIRLVELLCLFYISAEAEASARPHEDDLIAQMKIGRGVGYHDNGLILLSCQLLQADHQILLCPRIQAGGGLIQEKQLGIRQKLYRDAGTFFLTSGKFPDISIFMSF